MAYNYKLSMTSDNQAFLFADLGADLDEQTLPEFENAPRVKIVSAVAANISLASEPTASGFSLFADAQAAPSVTNPITVWIEIESQDDEEEETEHVQLITKAYVKENLPKWETYCTRSDELKTAEEMLQIAIDRAEDEFLSHTTVTAAAITDQQKAMVLAIAKFNCWKFMHGDSPKKASELSAIEKDYNDVKQRLEKNMIGSSNITITTKTREFKSGSWFHDEADENASSS